MGRPSKLTETQWKELGSRLLGGEKAASLAREYGVPRSAISERFSERNRTVRELATQVVEVNRAITARPVEEQKAIHQLVEDMETISRNYTSQAVAQSEAGRLLSTGALAQLKGIILTRPLTDEDRDGIKDAVGMIRAANEAAVPTRDMLTMNKDRMVRELEKADVVEMEPANVRELPMLDAAKAYQDFVSGQG